jgi:hypothetical protein
VVEITLKLTDGAKRHSLERLVMVRFTACAD